MKKEPMTYDEWKEATKDACRTREQFIAGDEAYAEVLIKFEEYMGLLQKVASIPLSKGRFVLMMRFERKARVIFHNPENKDDETLEANLSFEALAAFSSLASLMLESADFEAMQDQAAEAIEGRQSKGGDQ